MEVKDGDWPSSGEVPALGDREVHVWCASLDPSTATLRRRRLLLSEDERSRAKRFHSQSDRDRFIAARGLLRILLGRYLTIDPSELQFCFSPLGKPALDKQRHGEDLRFNVSHSHRVVLYAVTRGREVGIDIEWIRTDIDIDEMSRRFFSAREIAVLQTLPPQIKAEAFFNCWTRKEAYIKALGEGLSHSLQDFAVSLAPGEPAALLWIRGEGTERWSMTALTPEPCYAAALCVEGPGRRLKCRRWSAE